MPLRPNVEDRAGGDAAGSSSNFLLSPYSGDSMGEGSSCWRDTYVSCEAVDSLRSMAREVYKFGGWTEAWNRGSSKMGALANLGTSMSFQQHNFSATSSNKAPCLP
jgi:hypothetical protein